MQYLLTDTIEDQVSNLICSKLVRKPTSTGWPDSEVFDLLYEPEWSTRGSQEVVDGYERSYGLSWYFNHSHESLIGHVRFYPLDEDFPLLTLRWINGDLSYMYGDGGPIRKGTVIPHVNGSTYALSVISESCGQHGVAVYEGVVNAIEKVRSQS